MTQATHTSDRDTRPTVAGAGLAESQLTVLRALGGDKPGAYIRLETIIANTGLPQVFVVSAGKVLAAEGLAKQVKFNHRLSGFSLTPRGCKLLSEANAKRLAMLENALTCVVRDYRKAIAGTATLTEADESAETVLWALGLANRLQGNPDKAEQVTA